MFLITGYAVSCWCPAQFTASHRMYANDFCRNKLEYEEICLPKHVPFTQLFPEYYLNKTVTVHNSRNNFKYLLPVELVVAVGFFVIVHHFCNCLNPKEKLGSQSESTSGRPQVGYYIVQLVTAVLWIGLAVGSTMSIKETGLGMMKVFMCNFQASNC